MSERPILFNGEMVRAILAGSKTQTRRPVTARRRFRPPFGKAGEYLWLRETWQFADWTEDGQPFVRYAADDAVRFCEGAGEGEALADVWAELSAPNNYNIDGKAADRRWRPSIHMPRWASRISLRVVDVRQERVRDITEADAVAEGISTYEGYACQRFRDLWNQLYRPLGLGWDDDPSVWVYSFEVVR